MKLFLENKGIDEISKELSLTTLQTNRYFHKFIRKHIQNYDELIEYTLNKLAE